MALNRTYRRNADVVSRLVLGEALLVPIRGQLADLQRIFMLNPTAQYIWGQLDGERSLATICDSITAEYAVAPAQAEADLDELVAALAAAGLVAEAEAA
jgi:hypothetical protein